MNDDEFLSTVEIRKLTGRARAPDQVIELERMGVAFRVDGMRPIVSRFHVRQWLAGVDVARPRGPNLAAVR